MSYYEPGRQVNLPDDCTVHYCSLISSLVLIIEGVCNQSGWHVFSAERGLEPLCGNEHCVNNCVDDEQIKRHARAFLIPRLANLRVKGMAEDPGDGLLTIRCYQCGVEFVDEQKFIAGHESESLEVCPGCGSTDLKRQYWLPTPARTQEEAQSDFERFIQIEAPEETPGELESMLFQLCVRLDESEEDSDRQSILEVFRQFCRDCPRNRLEDIRNILAHLQDGETVERWGSTLLENVEEILKQK